MNEKLLEVKILSERLTKVINEYFDFVELERVIVKKEQFYKIRHLGKLNLYFHVFDYCNGMLFTLPDSKYSNDYETLIYSKLMSGELEQLVINKKKTPINFSGYKINYELEPIESTKLFNLYPNPQSV
jgi:hypothetical protein